MNIKRQRKLRKLPSRAFSLHSVFFQRTFAGRNMPLHFGYLISHVLLAASFHHAHQEVWSRIILVCFLPQSHHAVCLFFLPLDGISCFESPGKSSASYFVVFLLPLYSLFLSHYKAFHKCRYSKCIF